MSKYTNEGQRSRRKISDVSYQLGRNNKVLILEFEGDDRYVVLGVGDPNFERLVAAFGAPIVPGAYAKSGVYPSWVGKWVEIYEIRETIVRVIHRADPCEKEKSDQPY